MNHGELKWTDVDCDDTAQRVVVLPLGSLEQHGHHLPLLTDTMIGAEIVRRAELQLGAEAYFLPILWIGASDHHLAFPGTVSLQNSVYIAVITDMLNSLIGAGYRKIFLLNAHGGNINPARMAIYDVQLKHKQMSELIVAFSSWWVISAPDIQAISELNQKIVTHACELETSMILCLRPELVDMSVACGTSIPFDSKFYTPDFSGSSRVDISKMFDQLSVYGAFGHPELGTSEKGEALYSVVTEQVVAFVREFGKWTSIEAN